MDRIGFPLLSVFLVQHLADQSLQLTPEGCREIHDVDGFGYVVDVADEGPDGRQRKQQSEEDRKLRNERLTRGLGKLEARMYGAEHGDAVDEGRDEDTEDDLICPIAHEVAEETRAVI